MRMDPKYFGPDKSAMDPKAAVKKTSQTNLYTACLCSYLTALSMGYMIGYSSPALPQMTGAEGPLDTESASWFGSLVTIGAMMGCPLGGWLVEKAGRKGTLLTTAMPFLLGWGVIMFSSDIGLLCLGRLLTGVGSGLVTVTASMFISEISTKELRGMLGSGVQLFITLGILLVYGLGLIAGWRTLAFVGFCIPLVAVPLTLRVPETPRYLLARGRRQDTIRALGWLRGPNVDVEEEVRDMEESLDSDDSKVAWKDFCKADLFQPLRVSIGLMFFQQLSGINVVMFYTVSIFQAAGFKESGQLATVMIGVVQVIATVISCVLMDKAGRRILLQIGGLGMALTTCTMGVYYHKITADPALVESLSWLAMTSLVVYIIAFALGWGPIPLLVMSEIFPVKARGSASAIASIINWTFAFIITKEFASLQALLGQDGAFWFFSVFCVLSMVFVWRLVPETKGKSLEDIELYFLGRSVRGI